MNQSCSPQSLIVVGAGMAGIKFAHCFLESNPDTRVIILEANDYIGGRMRCCRFEGHTVEMGANWISGLETKYDNPVWKLARDAELNGHFSDRDQDDAAHAIDSSGNDVNSQYAESARRFEETYQRGIKISVEKGINPHNDRDARSFLGELGWKENELSTVDKAVEYNTLEVWVADSIDHLSVAHDMREGANDLELGKEEFFVEDKRGFNCILNRMVRDIKKEGGIIKLATQVEVIQYLPGDVKVVAKDIESGITTEYSADVIVCTVSLGVLQKNMIKFSPPLPDWKTQALNEIKMGMFSKVFVKFEEKFWTDSDQLIICSEKKGYYPFWMKYRNAKDQHLFMCYLGGDEAKRVESLSPEEIKDEVEELFRNAYQNNLSERQSLKAFRPSAVEVTDWSQNPHFCGSYSYFPVHSFAQVPEADLTRGLTGAQGQEGPVTLHFAGECYDDKFNGWVQGAYRSGERVAKLLSGTK